MFYSKTTGGFYTREIHGGNIPGDVVQVTTDEHAALIAAQSSGKRIIADASGKPIAVWPDSLLTLDQTKEAHLSALSAACRSQILDGFLSDALGALHAYPAKETDQSNLSASVLASLMPGNTADWTTPFWCQDEAGEWAFVPHTAAQIQQVGRDAKAATLAAMLKNETLAAQVRAATTIAAVKAIVW